jgi:hypothetical protein
MAAAFLALASPQLSLPPFPARGDRH